jgi:hypothetical protein
MVIGTTADYLWSKEPDLADWLERARLNPARGLRARRQNPEVQQASKRFADHVRPAMDKLRELLAQGSA